VRVAKPSILAQLPRGGHAVIEASAGTGKTFTLEHLVVELILEQGCTMDGLLVVTFTEKATAELKTRVRATLERLLAIARRELPAVEPEPDAPAWTLDGGAAARLERALLDFERAQISTIHGFCQRVLTEYAFTERRLFEQAQVDGRAALGAAFAEALRHELTMTPQAREALELWLERRDGDIGKLVGMIGNALSARAHADALFDESALTASVRAIVPRLARGGVEVETLVSAEVRAALEAFEAGGTLRLVAAFDDDRVVDSLKRATKASTGGLHQALKALEVVLPTLDAAVVARLLGPVARRLRARKRDLGLYDFDDMLTLVAGALDGHEGPALAAELRARYQVALVDEFQDTDEVQWSIFQRVFFESSDPVRPLYLVGDPKQSIYGFRGADVSTYLRAREVVRRAGGTVVALEECFRSTPALIEAVNAVLDQRASPPFFAASSQAALGGAELGGGIRYDRPVRAGRPDLAAVDGAGRAVAPVVLFEIDRRRDDGPGGERGRFAAHEVRALLLDAISEEIARLLGGGLRVGEAPVGPRDIFVLTRSRDEGVEVARALAARGLPHALYKQEGLFATDEAHEVLDLLRALESPERRDLVARAWASAFFGVPLEALARVEDLEELPPQHPLFERLRGWRQLAQSRAWPRLFGRILDESGVAARCLAAVDGERKLTNITHLFDLLLEAARAGRGSLRELSALLASWIDGTGLPPGESADVQRLPSEREAVQIMTMHKAKGLEAAAVFLYNGFSPARTRGAEPYLRFGRRRLQLGRTRSKEILDAIEEWAKGETERLLYVALTRARARLYLPHLVDGWRAGTYDALNKRLGVLVKAGTPGIERRALTGAGAGAGAARPVLRVVRDGEEPPAASAERGGRSRTAARAGAAAGGAPAVACAATGTTTAPGEREDERRDREAPARATTDAPPAATRRTAAAVITAAEEALATADARARLVAARAGAGMTSYSRMKREAAERGEGGARRGRAVERAALGAAGEGGGAAVDADEAPASAAAEEAPADEAAPAEGALPGGAEVGVFLHEILEELPLAPFADGDDLDRFRARPEVAAIVEAALHKHDVDVRHRDEVERLVWAAYATPIVAPPRPGAAVGPSLPRGLGAATRALRELELVYPFPSLGEELAAAPRPDAPRGYVRSIIDLLAESDGRVWLVDWKSDVLPSYEPAAVAAHVEAHYRLQLRLYAVGLARMLGARGPAELDARLGGIAYVFLRGLPAEGAIATLRPTWDELTAWLAEIAQMGPGGDA